MQLVSNTHVSETVDLPDTNQVAPKTQPRTELMRSPIPARTPHQQRNERVRTAHYDRSACEILG